jgi:ketosteroid isomerase-like protein
MSQESLQVVESFYNAMKAADLGTALGLIDENVVWTEAENFVYADLSPYKGRDNLVNGLFMRFATDWSGFTSVPKQMVSSSDTVVVFGRYMGTYRPTAKSLDAQFVHVYKVAQGKIAEFQQYTDTAQFRDAFAG